MADISTIISEALLVLNAAQKLVQIGIDAAPKVADAIEILSGKKTLTEAERAALISEQQIYEQTIDNAVAADAAAAAEGGTGT